MSLKKEVWTNKDLTANFNEDVNFQDGSGNYHERGSVQFSWNSLAGTGSLVVKVRLSGHNWDTLETITISGATGTWSKYLTAPIDEIRFEHDGSSITAGTGLLTFLFRDNL